MLSLPEELTHYWLAHSLENKSPAYFQVTDAGNLIRWGGNIECYDPPTLNVGTFIGECFPFLAHSFPMQNVTESMQWVEMESGLILDVHFHFAQTQGWILFLESGDEAQKVQSLMQQGNELKLLRQKYDKVVQRQLEREQSSLILESLLDLSPDHTSTGISILQIRLNQHYSEATEHSQEALAQLNLQLKVIFKTAVEKGGVIHHVFGQTIAVLFGLLPSPLGAAQHAVQAAQGVVREYQQQLSAVRAQTIVMGIGITTGRLDIDIRPVKNRKIFHLIGQTIVRAEEMLLMLQPGILIIDQNTFNLSGDLQADFSPWSPSESNVPCNALFYAHRLND